MSMEEQRLDKWLWCARLFKTRGLAGDWVRAGRVDVNERRAKPARPIRIGDAVTVRRPPYEWQMTVTGLAKQRVPADLTGELYSESAESRGRREALSQSIKAGATIDHRRGKLTKKERRERERMKREI
jgi:ribosome-associated heat shock protein Hsp15